jgi:hypothetical protein
MIDSTPHEHLENFELEEVNIEDCKTIDKSYIVNRALLSTLDDYLCSICSGLVINPKMCSECYTLFCNKCLQSNLKHKDDCPSCRSQPFESMNFTKQMKNYLNDIQLKCPLDCDEKFKYQKLKSHLSECEYFNKTYSCRECEEIVRARGPSDASLNNHMENCRNKRIKCKYCNYDFTFKELSIHENNCDLKPINCDKCLIGYLKEFENVHRDYYCQAISSIIEEIY